MYCLDTNIIVSVMRGDENLNRKIISTQPEEICTTVINICELFKGAYEAEESEKAISLVNDFLKTYDIFLLNIKSSHIFGSDHNKLKKVGKLTKESDLMIASIAKANNLTLITRDKKHFENIPDLKIEEW